MGQGKCQFNDLYCCTIYHYLVFEDIFCSYPELQSNDNIPHHRTVLSQFVLMLMVWWCEGQTQNKACCYWHTISVEWPPRYRCYWGILAPGVEVPSYEWSFQWLTGSPGKGNRSALVLTRSLACVLRKRSSWLGDIGVNILLRVVESNDSLGATGPQETKYLCSI